MSGTRANRLSPITRKLNKSTDFTLKQMASIERKRELEDIVKQKL